MSTLFTFSAIKMESDKEHICRCLLFCFHQKKSAAVHTELFMRRIVKIL